MINTNTACKHNIHFWIASHWENDKYRIYKCDYCGISLASTLVKDRK